MLMMTLGLMGGGTFLIGCLPNFATIGIAAPILLVLLRIVQGIGVGGEWGGAALMATEYAPAERRGFFGSWPQIGVPAGTLLANGAFYIMGYLISPGGFLAWGWRIPFLVSILLVVLSSTSAAMWTNPPPSKRSSGRAKSRRCRWSRSSRRVR